MRAGVPASYAILRLLKAHALHEPDKGGLTGGVLLKDTGILQNMAEHGADLGLDGLVGVLRLHVGAVLCNQLVDPVGMDGQRVARLAAGVRALPGQNFRDLRALILQAGGQVFLLLMNAWCLRLFTSMVGTFIANPLSL